MGCARGTCLGIVDQPGPLPLGSWAHPKAPPLESWISPRYLPWDCGSARSTSLGIEGQAEAHPGIVGSTRGASHGIVGSCRGTFPGIVGSARRTSPRIMGSARITIPGLVGQPEAFPLGIAEEARGTPPGIVQLPKDGKYKRSHQTQPTTTAEHDVQKRDGCFYVLEKLTCRDKVGSANPRNICRNAQLYEQ